MTIFNNTLDAIYEMGEEDWGKVSAPKGRGTGFIAEKLYIVKNKINK